MRGVEAERRHSPAKSCSELLRGGLGWKKMAGREVEIEAGVRWASPHCARMNDLVIILQTLMPERVASIQPTSVYLQPAHHPSIHPSFLLLCVCSLVNHHLSTFFPHLRLLLWLSVGLFSVGVWRRGEGSSESTRAVPGLELPLLVLILTK